MPGYQDTRSVEARARSEAVQRDARPGFEAGSPEMNWTIWHTRVPLRELILWTLKALVAYLVFAVILLLVVSLLWTFLAGIIMALVAKHS